MSSEITVIDNEQAYRASTDAAGLCKQIVTETAVTIQGRKYVKCEGWQAIAVAHGCVASSEDVQRVEDEGGSGYRAIGVIRKIGDGTEIARAEGFLGDDEKVWASRSVYARRAMVQTRAISRACRSAFAHVVVMMNAGLSTTPAEEVPDEGFQDAPKSAYRARKDGDWDALKTEMMATDTPDALKTWGEENVARINRMPKDWVTEFQDLYNDHLLNLEDAERKNRALDAEFKKVTA